jgi:putative transposase
MPFNPDAHHRRTVRLPDAHYRDGCYFITICAAQKLPLFGEIRSNACVLNPIGQIIEDCWLQVPDHQPFVQLDAFIVMPNHLHAVLFIDQHTAPQHNPRQFGASQTGQLSSVIAAFKAAVTRTVNREIGEPGGKLWQRSYFERIVRNSEAYHRIRAYIHQNPENWETDEENPERRSP